MKRKKSQAIIHLFSSAVALHYYDMLLKSIRCSSVQMLWNHIAYSNAWVQLNICILNLMQVDDLDSNSLFGKRATRRQQLFV